MIIGVPKEIKNKEGRVGLDPKHVGMLVQLGHEILIERAAGVISGFSDSEYFSAGARLVTRDDVWTKSGCIIKVKEPLPEEYPYLRPGLIVLAFFHFAGNPQLKEVCLKSGIISYPYESIYAPDGSRPILKAMSLVAGEIAVDVGAHYLRQKYMGRGILLRDSIVTIIGALGVAGFRAYEIIRNGYSAAKIYAIDLSSESSGKRINPNDFYLSTPQSISTALSHSDLVIGAAAVNPKDNLPKLITRQMVVVMRSGSVFVDIAIDEGGTSETSFVTSHDKPIYIESGVVHYCVPNMPGAVPRSSTPALVGALYPYIDNLISNKISS